MFALSDADRDVILPCVLPRTPIESPQVCVRVAGAHRPPCFYHAYHGSHVPAKGKQSAI